MSEEITSEQDLPFRAEYAKSGRAACKGCKNPIAKDSLRIGIMIQSPHFDGKIPLWHHAKCFFLKKKLTSVGDMANFQKLRWEDQKYIKDAASGASGSGNGSTASTKASSEKSSETKPAKKSKSSKAKANGSGSDFSIEYAKTGRSSCKVCGEKIVKDSIRVSKMDYESETARRFGPCPGWHHVDCFARAKDDLGFSDAANQLPGFSDLSEEDQALVAKKIKGNKKNEKKRKSDEEVEQKSEVPEKKTKTDSKEEKILKKQSELIFGFHDKLRSKLNKKQWMALLEYNDQESSGGESDILDRLSDCLAFGALEKCPECKTGQLSVRSFGYKCTGFLTGWTKCQFVTKTPKRKEFIIPEEFQEIDFLANYKYVKRDRVFASNLESSSSKNNSKKPLEKFKIAVAGNLKKSKEELETLITGLGGKLGTKIDKKTTCLITTKDFCDGKKGQILTAEKYDVPIISEDFLESVKNGGSVSHITNYLLQPWTGKLEDKIGSKLKKSSGGDTSKSMKILVQGAAAVDPESGLEHSAHVYEKNGEPYNAVLGLVDIVKGTNSYYKLQLLQANNLDRYFVFRSWGRIGTTVGNNKIEVFGTLQEAIDSFKFLYFDKTENKWEDRKNFVKKPNRFYPLDIDYGQEDSEAQKIKKLEPGSNSKLPKPVQELICLIFDVEAMKKAMLEFEIDLQKMPLGKLSKKQIKSAYSVLTELLQLIQGDKNMTKLVDASNRFYTLIPHDFGMQKPPLLDNETLLKTKIVMLDSLLEIEVAYNLLKETNANVSPIENHYLQLKTDIEILDKECEEFKRIENYMKNTHAETHDQYKLQLDEVFKIHRHGESERYQKFKNLHNKKLLWHGSRTTNFAGILSQGLRIAPPEAPVTGYMFGKGIYFADMVSKSANYCFTNRSKPTGILLLCEVALGNMYERTTAEYIEKLPKNKHSTKGLGQTEPDPKESITVDDIEIPLGKPVKSNVKNSSLLYNEYIVYDVNQVNIKYLLKVKFNWRR